MTSTMRQINIGREENDRIETINGGLILTRKRVGVYLQLKTQRLYLAGPRKSNTHNL